MMADIDVYGGKAKVWGKESREREVMFQDTTRRFLNQYMMLIGVVHHDYLWITDMGTIAIGE